MGLQFFKATAKTTGCACELSVNAKDEAVYINFIQQTGWSNATKTGVFKGGKQASVKFKISEVGAIIDSIQSGREFKAFHKNASGATTQISFGPYFPKLEDGTNGPCKGFSLSIARGGVTEGERDLFRMGFVFGEAIALKQYLIFALEHIYTAIYSKDKQARAARTTKKETEAPAGSPEPTSEPDGPVDDSDPFAGASE